MKRTSARPAGRALSFVAVVAGLTVACSDDPVDPGPLEPTPGLQLAGEEFVMATVGDTLNGALTVRVVNLLDGSPLSGQDVTFTITDGEGGMRYETTGGRITAGGAGATISAPTDETGEVGVDYFVSTTAGFGGVAVTSGVASDTLYFGVVGEAGPVAIVLRSGEGQVGVPGEPLAFPVGVVTQDAFGNAVAGVDVVWTIRGGGGSLESSEATTNLFGQASARWALGPEAGSNVLDATVEGVSTFAFSALAR